MSFFDDMWKNNKIIETGVASIPGTNGQAVKVQLPDLTWPSKFIHNQAVNIIIKQLEDLKKEVDIKARQSQTQVLKFS